MKPDPNERAVREAMQSQGYYIPKSDELRRDFEKTTRALLFLTILIVIVLVVLMGAWLVCSVSRGRC